MSEWTADLNGDGYAETTYFDANDDGYAESAWQDTNLDGYVDTTYLDDQTCGFYNKISVDTNLDGTMDVIATDYTLDGIIDVFQIDQDHNGSFETELYRNDEDFFEPRNFTLPGEYTNASTPSGEISPELQQQLLLKDQMMHISNTIITNNAMGLDTVVYW